MKTGTGTYIIGLIAALLFNSFLLHSQTSMQSNSSDNSFLNNSKPKLSVSLSSSFSSLGPGYNFFGTSVIPQISFPISNSLSLSAGIGYSKIFAGNASESLLHSNQSNYGHVFVSGNYMVNKKISVRGTAYKTFILGSPTITEQPSNPNAYNYSSQGIIMDVEYKVTDKFRINVGFEYREQNHPLFSPDFNHINPAFNSPSYLFPGFSGRNSLNSF